jgi:hypothetical protein
VYELSPTQSGWSETTLYSPNGSSGFGEIFRLTPSGNQWLYSPFYQFDRCNGDGCDPTGTVTFDANGNMYGTTYTGGTDEEGTVWEITP